MTKTLLTPFAERFWAKVRKSPDQDGCWEWIGAKRMGYGAIGRGRRGEGVMDAHRVSYEMHCGDIGDLWVLHRCDNRACVRPDHLFLGTNADNMADKIAKGRQAKGPNHGLKGVGNGRAKLTDREVDEIRDRYAKGRIFQKQLAAKFGVSQHIISSIVRRQSWKHLT